MHPKYKRKESQRGGNNPRKSYPQVASHHWCSWDQPPFSFQLSQSFCKWEKAVVCAHRAPPAHSWQHPSLQPSARSHVDSVSSSGKAGTHTREQWGVRTLSLASGESGGCGLEVNILGKRGLLHTSSKPRIKCVATCKTSKSQCYCHLLLSLELDMPKKTSGECCQ